MIIPASARILAYEKNVTSVVVVLETVLVLRGVTIFEVLGGVVTVLETIGVCVRKFVILSHTAPLAKVSPCPAHFTHIVSYCILQLPDLKNCSSAGNSSICIFLS